MQIVFTVITNGYDDLKSVHEPNKDVRYICITDDMTIAPKGWELMPIEALEIPKRLSGVKLQRWVKVIGGYEYFQCNTIYVDGKLELCADISPLFNYLNDYDIVFEQHPDRDCFIDEGKRIIELKKDSEGIISKHIAHNIEEGLQPNSGMMETRILVRRYNSTVATFNSWWWHDIYKFSHRDQMSVMLALEKVKPNYRTIPSRHLRSYFRVHRHNEGNICTNMDA